jgi:5'-3' exonuclease
MAGPLLVVDGPSLMFRAFFALPDSITDGEGRPVNALLGTVNLILRTVEDHAPRAVVVCFGEEAAHYRVELYEPYHADRPPVPDHLERQFAEVADLFAAFGWIVASHDELEPDDLLGSYAQVEADAGGTALILTGDRDMYQCASDQVTVLYLGSRQKGTEAVTPAEVKRRYGIPPELVPDFIALRGDPSDSLPGARGIGDKTAADLLRRHGSLEGAIAGALREQRPALRSTLRAQADELRSFREIATLQLVDVERPPDSPTDFAGGAAAARARGMNRLGERLEKLAAAR